MKEKMKQILLNIYSILKKFPVFMALIIIVPSLAFTGRYFFMSETYYNNFFFFGESVKCRGNEFELKGIRPLFTTMDVTSTHNFQGGTCYENYYVLCANNFEALLIYNMLSGKVEHVIMTNQYNTLYHCNTIFFGPEFYSSIDKFPVLFVSMENIGETIGYRIHQQDGIYKITEVQRITLQAEGNDKIYFPNSYLDYDNEYLIYSGYTKNTYMEEEDNKLRYYVFDLPNLRFRSEVLIPLNAVNTFELPSLTATQGGFISEGFLYQTFSFHSDTDIKRAPKMRVVNIHKQTIVKQYDDLGASFGHYDEFENIAICGDGNIYGHGQRAFKIYQFDYNINETSEEE